MRFARLVGVLDGLDFGPLGRPFAPIGAGGQPEPNPYLERQRLEAAALAILADDAARTSVAQAHETAASLIDRPQ